MTESGAVPVSLADLEILRNRVWYRHCRRWVRQLLLLTDWSLVGDGCAGVWAGLRTGTS